MAIKPQSDNERAIRYENEQKYKAYKAAKEAEKPLLTAPPRNTSRQKLISFFDKAKSKATPSTFRGIFIIFFAFIAFSTLIRYLINPELPTLTLNWLITVIQGTPQLSFDWLVTSSVDLGDWAFNIGTIAINFNELRDAIYYIYSAMIQPIIIILQAIIQIVGFIGYFIGKIFML